MRALASGGGGSHGGEPWDIAEEPEDDEGASGPVDRAISTSVGGNSAAFGFSIMITVSFGMVSRVRGEPSVLEMLLFGVAAAIAVASLEGLVTRGFRGPLAEVPGEVQLLGTAMNFASVAAGVGVAVAVAELVDGTPAWPAASFLAATAYVATESAEILLAERIEAARSDRGAE